MYNEQMIVPPNSKIKLEDYDPEATGQFKQKEDAHKKLVEDVEALSRLQDILYSQGKYAILIVLQGMDTSGKDGVIKHVMSGLNPQGVQVVSFKGPTSLELKHDYLWRCAKALPERGRIGIFNRSYYEEVLTVRVHPALLEAQRLPGDATGKSIWEQRYEDIKMFERHLTRNGTIVLKFFLNLSKKEQKRRLLERINISSKNWKLSAADLKERKFWKEYRVAHEDALNETSSEWAPWYIIPADHKWHAHIAVADIIVSKMKNLNLTYPTLSAEDLEVVAKAKQILESE